MKGCIEAVQGDITSLEVDAIVNAANKKLLGGGGVDGAIHRAAGPQLLKACLELHGCEVGEAKITKGYNLPAQYVIHTVGPVWGGGKRHKDTLLADCYRNSLELAARHRVKTIAFPAISTGVYRFPSDRACAIAVKTIRELPGNGGPIEKVIFCCFNTKTYELYKQALDE